MIFVRIFWKNNVPEAYLPKMSISGQIVPEIVAQLCLENPIQTLLIFFWVDPPQKIILWVQCKPGGRKFSIIVMLSTKKKQNKTTGHQHNNNNNNNINNHRQDWSHREMNLQPLPWKRLDLRVARMTMKNGVPVFRRRRKNSVLKYCFSVKYIDTQIKCICSRFLQQKTHVEYSKLRGTTEHHAEFLSPGMATVIRNYAKLNRK